MPSDLRFEPVPVSMAPLGPESTPPDLIGTQILQNQLTFELDETDELHEGYGRVPNAFPYRSFSCYSSDGPAPINLGESQSVQMVGQTGFFEDFVKSLDLFQTGGKMFNALMINRLTIYQEECL